MSKKFTKTVLSAAMAGILFGVSFDIMAAQSQCGDRRGDLGTLNNTVNCNNNSLTGNNSELNYSVYQFGNDKNKLSSQKFYIKYNPNTKEAKIYLGTNPDQVKMANKELYAINSSGDVVVRSNDGKLSFSYYDKDVHDFMNSMGSENIHNMSEDEIRSLINRVESIKKISVNTDTVLDPLLKIEGNKSAVGEGAIAKGEYSSALGESAVAVGLHSTAVGANSYAKGDKSTSVGMSSAATGENSSALGLASHAYGKNSVAVGAGSHVDADAGVALGTASQATHKNSVALGTKSVTTRDNEVYIGYKTENGKAYGTRVLGGLSDGTRNSDAATVGQLNRKVGEVYDDVKARITVESEKQKKYTDQKTSEVNEKVEARTTVGVDSDGKLTRAEGATKTIAVNDGLLTLAGETDRLGTAVGAVDSRVSANTQAVQKNSRTIASNTRTLQQHSARLDSQQRQINENHKEMKRAAAQSAALTGLFQPYSVGKFNASAAVGGYSDEQALAVGMGYRFNEQTAAKAGVAFSDGDASWNVGVNFEF